MKKFEPLNGLVIDEPEAIKVFLEYDQRPLTQEEKDSLKESYEYYMEHKND